MHSQAFNFTCTTVRTLGSVCLCLCSGLLCSPPWTVLGQTCHGHGPRMEPASQHFIVGKDNQLKCRRRLTCMPESQGRKLYSGYSSLQVGSPPAMRRGEAPGCSHFLIILPKCLSLSSQSSLTVFPLRKEGASQEAPPTLSVPFILPSVDLFF